MTGMPLPDRGERAVCRRCGMVMDDCEPMGATEFWHKKKHADGMPSKCKNAGKPFYPGDSEIEPFMRKRVRRATKRRRVTS